MPLTKFVIGYSDLDENFLRAYLQLLVVTPQVLVEVVADPESLFSVQKAISKLLLLPSLSQDVKEVISLIQDCINPTQAPQVST